MNPIVFELPDKARAALVPKGQYVVLRVSGSSRFVNRDYAPSHLLSESDPELRGANVVFDWVLKHKPTGEERAMARLYLSQWPDGPQVDAEGTTQETEPVAEAPAPAHTPADPADPESKRLEELSPTELFDVINRMVWELGNHETDSDRALALRPRIQAALSLLRAAWRRAGRLE